MDKAATRDAVNGGELHHIVPKCLGGTECVRLTHREHFVAHLLLRKMMIDPIHRQKMHLAFFALCNGFNKSSVFSTSRWFEIARIGSSAAKSKALSGRKFSEHSRERMSISQKAAYEAGVNSLVSINSTPRTAKHTQSISKAKKGKPAGWINSLNNDKIKLKISQALTGRRFSTEHKENISKSLRGKPSSQKGKSLTLEHKAKLQKPKTEAHRQALKKPKSRACCIFCHTEASVGVIKRFHSTCQ